jgi:two-component system sensor kinase FixL
MFAPNPNKSSSCRVSLRSLTGERGIVFAAALLWIVGIGVIDWLTGSEVSISVFYLPAVSLAAWFSGRQAALWMAAMAWMAWITAELAGSANYSSPVVLLWNSLIRFSFFLVAAVLTAEVRIRRKAEATLKDQKGILGSILNSMSDGVAVVDGVGSIIVFNPAAERIFGINSAGLGVEEWLRQIERNSLQGMPNGRECLEALRLAATGRQHGDTELILRSPEGEGFISVQLTSRPLCGQEQEVNGSVMVLSDTTARRELEKQIAEVSEREQRRIGQDLHDGVCQHFVGVAFAAGALQNELETMGLERQAALAGRVAELVNAGIGQARDLAHGLYPVGLEQGLDTALHALASDTEENTGISCRFKWTDDLIDLDPTVAMHLYRIAQECVANAMRHASPGSIVIELRRHQNELQLSVQDDGGGMNLEGRPPRGIGMDIMTHRASLLGGRIEVRSDANGGTCVTCILPGHAKRVLPAPRQDSK